MRKELKELHHRLGVTMIYVTHDQIEALTLADRIVVMKDGYVQQVATPQELYDYPKNLFVANFIGTPPMNFFDSTLDEEGKIHIGDIKVDISSSKMHEVLKKKGYFGKPIILGVRPENIVLNKPCNCPLDDGFKTTIQVYELLGSDALVHILINDKSVMAKINARTMFHTGEEALFNFDINHIYYFDKETEECIYE
jgi:multiple sugar transport system ATP-binding protein